MLVSYNWLQDYLGADIPSAEALAGLLTFHSFEIEGVEQKGDDWVIDVDVLPNRSSDCLCHRGIAREIATLLKQSLVHDPLQNTPEIAPLDTISVDIESAEICPRFTASLITGIEIKDSPAWLQTRLQALGQRPINNIVDATNYVMYALGQPLHAYDADLFPQVDGAWRFGVRYAQVGETVSLLAEGGKDEDRVVELTGTEVLVVDNSSNTPIGLAGVKGGRFAGVHADTTKVIIEAAHWNPTITRKTARNLGIVIDASKRFENEPSRALPPYAQADIIKLITEIAGGQCEGMVDVYLQELKVPTVIVRPETVNALLGLSLAVPAMVAILERAGITVVIEDEVLQCTGPTERTDLTIEEDFIEEIGRLHGYDKVESVVPEPIALTELNARHYYSEKVRDCLLQLGFSEVITSSFRKKDTVQLRNALASDKSFLRSSLIKNITETLDANAGRTDLFGATDTRVFEIGTVFDKGGDLGVTEHIALCLGVRLKSSGYTGKEDKILESVCTEIETLLNSPIDWTIEKGVAEINFTKLFSALPAPTAYEPVAAADEIVYEPFSLYQHMSRDIAMWVSNSPEEDLTKGDVEKVLNEAAGDLRVRTTFVDEFTKDGRTSLAFRLVFQSNEKTLTDEEVNAVMDTVYKAVAAEKWETR